MSLFHTNVRKKFNGEIPNLLTQYFLLLLYLNNFAYGLRIVLALTIIFCQKILLASFTGCVVWVIMSNYSSLEDSCRQPSPVSMIKSCYSYWALHKRRYQRAHKCVSSKAALIILVWIFLTLLASFLTSTSFFDIFHYKVSPLSYELYSYISSLSYCIYPVAGYLTDVKFGRHKTVIKSFNLNILFLLIFSLLVLILLFAPTGNKLATYSLIIIISVAGLLLFISLVTLNANFIQFGMDQLHDSPEGHQSLFIHWYIWISQLVSSSIQVASTLLTYNKLQYFIVSFIPVIILLLLSVVVAKRRENWFLIDHARPNPYRLIYKLQNLLTATKFPFVAVPLHFAKMMCPQGWIWARPNMVDHFQQRKSKMSRSSMAY